MPPKPKELPNDVMTQIVKKVGVKTVENYLSATKRSRALAKGHSDIIQFKKTELNGHVRNFAKVFIRHLDTLIGFWRDGLGLSSEDTISFLFPGHLYPTQVEITVSLKIEAGDEHSFTVSINIHKPYNPIQNLLALPIRLPTLKADKTALENGIVSSLLGIANLRKLQFALYFPIMKVYETPQFTDETLRWNIYTGDGEQPNSILRNIGYRLTDVFEEPTYFTYMASAKKLHEACKSFLEFITG